MKFIYGNIDKLCVIMTINRVMLSDSVMVGGVMQHSVMN